MSLDLEAWLSLKRPSTSTSRTVPGVGVDAIFGCRYDWYDSSVNCYTIRPNSING